jgi:hypothetical protein
MKRKNVTIGLWTCVAVSVLVLGLTALSARADWDPIYDPTGTTIINHKMHFPQLPDPFGWDVNATFPKTLADDWLCTGSGPVTDIHFWGSWHQDQQVPIESIRLSIHSDVPADPTNPDASYSHPGDLLWEQVFYPGEWLARVTGTGDQGWYDPNTGEFIRPDHLLTWQYNFLDIKDPFVQQRGTVYWLDVSVVLPAGVSPVFGWKTSLDHWGDDAVWTDVDASGAPVGLWNELRDPLTGESLDLAFVITPEPGTLLLLLAGGLAMIRRRR